MDTGRIHCCLELGQSNFNQWKWALPFGGAIQLSRRSEYSQESGSGPRCCTKELLGPQATTEDHETRTVLDVGNDMEDRQDSAEEWKMLWDKDTSH